MAQLVVHFLSDPVAGLREMARSPDPVASSPQASGTSGRDAGPVSLFWRAVLELDLAATDESDLPGARGGHLSALLEAAGTANVAETALTVSRSFAGFDDWWEPFTRGVEHGGAYVASLAADRTADLRARCRSMLPSGPFALTAAAWLREEHGRRRLTP